MAKHKTIELNQDDYELLSQVESAGEDWRAILRKRLKLIPTLSSQEVAALKISFDQSRTKRGRPLSKVAASVREKYGWTPSSE